MNRADSEAGAFPAIMGSNLNRTHGFMKYTVTAERIQAQFVATTKGGFGDQFTIADPHPAVPTPLAAVLSPITATTTTATTTTAPPAVPAPTAVRRRRRGRATGCWAADGAVYPFGEAGSFGSPRRRRRPLGRRRRTHAVGPGLLGPRRQRQRSAPSVNATGLRGGPHRRARARASSRRASRRLRAARATGCSPTGGGPCPSATPASWATSRRCRSTGPSSTRWPPRPGRATTWSPPTAASSPSATPASPAPWGTDRLDAPVQSLVPDADGSGYWLVASDGGIFAFDAPFKGSMGGKALAKPVTGMVRYGDGYLMVAEDGGDLQLLQPRVRRFTGRAAAGAADRRCRRRSLNRGRSAPADRGTIRTSGARSGQTCRPR